MLKPGDELPRFSVTTVDGRHVTYEDVRQRKNIVILSVPAENNAEAAGRIGEWRNSGASLRDADNEWLITSDGIDDLPQPGAVIADRWGEIHFADTKTTVPELPTADELAEWLEFLQHKCPECEGEAR